MLWQRLIGPQMRNVEMVDLDRDGSEDFLCGSQAACSTNYAADGSDDLHAYVFAFSSKGDPLWRTLLSSNRYASVEPLPADLDGAGRREILAWVRAPEVNYATNTDWFGKIVRLDPSTGHVLKAYEPQPPACFRSCVAVDIDGDGRDEVLCTDCEGYVHVLNPDLTLRERVQVYQGKPRRPGTFDLAALSLVPAQSLAPDRRLRFLMRSRMVRRDSFTSLGDDDTPTDPIAYENSEILVLDAQLRTIARYPVAQNVSGPSNWRGQLADMDGDGLDEILSLSDRVEVLKLRP
jgi:hypothetical protein